MSYDDLNLEIIELFNLILVYFFLFIIIYLLFKYSFHYFAFLEPTVTEGKSNLFILKQFVRDISNTFALFLRFFLLLFRLNIYDGLDDFLDSYALFFYDFDEDNLLFSSSININDDFNFNNSLDNNNQDKEITLFIFEEIYITNHDMALILKLKVTTNFYQSKCSFLFRSFTAKEKEIFLVSLF